MGKENGNMKDIDLFPCYGHHEDRNPRCNPGCPDEGLCILRKQMNERERRDDGETENQTVSQ